MTQGEGVTENESINSTLISNSDCHWKRGISDCTHPSGWREGSDSFRTSSVGDCVPHRETKLFVVLVLYLGEGT